MNGSRQGRSSPSGTPDLAARSFVDEAFSPSDESLIEQGAAAGAAAGKARVSYQFPSIGFAIVRPAERGLRRGMSARNSAAWSRISSHSAELRQTR